MNMVFSKQFVTCALSCIILFSACENKGNSFKDNFYNHSKRDAFRRLPLIKPFELINDGLGWSITLQYGKNVDLRVNNILIDSGRKIMGYGDNGEIIISHKDTVPGIVYFFIDLEKKQDDFSYDSSWFKHIMDSCSVSNEDFYTKKDIKDIYNNFNEKGILPWRKE